LVEYLVEHGVDINKENYFDKTPLFYACSSGNKELVDYLIENGADINKEDGHGETILFDACKSGNEDTVRYLLEFGADINKENKENNTILVNAFFSQNDNLVKYLIKQYLIRYSININIYKRKDIINNIYDEIFNDYFERFGESIELSYIKKVINSYRE